MNKLAQANCKPSNRIKRYTRTGLTLIELLVAVALTLVIILAMIKAFKASSDQISLGRAKMDMHNKMRVVGEQMRTDLQNMTRTPNPLSTNDGYFEYVEGDEIDADHFSDTLSFVGDHDDVIAMTVRSEGEPFVGRWVNDNGTPAILTDDTVEQVESYVAEVVWWIVHEDTFTPNSEVEYDEPVRLYRRVLLIRPDLAVSSVLEGDYSGFFQANDISAGVNDSGVLATNSLASLASRENRFGRDSTASFPFEIELSGLVLGGAVEGEDLMLDDCVAFDVKVYDPTAEVFKPTAALLAATPGLGFGQVLEYDDPGFADAVATYPPQMVPNEESFPQVGGYVNLGYDPVAPGLPVDPTTSVTGNTGRWFADDSYDLNYEFGFSNNTYCTWWDGYERNGVNEDVDDASDMPAVIDEGADGIDNDGVNGVDDNGELETRPPYAYPIRALEVSIRMIEKKSNLVLQKSIRESFVPN